MKLFNKIKGLFALAVLAVPLATSASQFVITNVPSGGTNAAGGTVTNTTSTQIVPISGSKSAGDPLSCGIFPQGAALTSGAWTNTYTFANSYDGATLANTNTWTVTLIGNGTNISKGYTFASNTNYYGSFGFGLLSVTEGGTNGITNGQIAVRFPN